MIPEHSMRGVLRRVFARVLTALVAVVFAFEPAVAVADDDEALVAAPRQIIDDAASQIVAVLARTEEPAEQRVREIEEIAYEIFDFTTMSKLVLARNWRKLDKPKRAEFVREFKTHLSRTYGTRLERFNDVDVEVYGSQVEVRNDVSVKTRLTLLYRQRMRPRSSASGKSTHSRQEIRGNPKT